MYYRKPEDNRRLKKLSSESRIFCKGAYFCEEKNRYVRLHPGRGIAYWKKQSNKRIRKCKNKSYKGSWYKKVFPLRNKVY